MGCVRQLAIWLIVTALWVPVSHAATANCTIAANEKAMWFDAVLNKFQQCRSGVQVDVGQEGVKKNVVAVTGMSGATATATNAIPAGVIVLAVRTEVKTTITGSGVTGYYIGDGSHPNRWGIGSTLTAGGTTDVPNFTVALSANVYQTATNVVLTAVGGTFTAGAVDVTVLYTDGTLIGAPAASPTNKVAADATDLIPGFLFDEILGDGNITPSVVDVAGNRKLQLSITGGIAQDTKVKVDATDVLASELVNKLAGGNDLVCSVIDVGGGNKRLQCQVPAWTKTVSFPAGAWSTLNCAAPAEVQLTTTKRKAWYVRNCAGTGDTNELHFSYKLPTNVDCTVPPRLRLFAESAAASPGGAQVTFRTQAFYVSAGQVEPNIMSTSTNGTGGVADLKSITFSQQYVLGNLLTDPLVVHGTCAPGAILILRVVLMGSLSTSGAIANLAIAEAELIHGLTRLSHQ